MEKTRSIVMNANDIIASDRMKEIIENYNTDTHYPKSQHVHNIVTGSAMKLVNDVIDNGGTDEEVNTAIEYLAVCIQSYKHHINIKKYGKENGVWDLRKKYQPWRVIKAAQRIEAMKKLVEKEQQDATI